MIDNQDDAAHPLDGKFEPEAKDIVTSQADAALVSIAISLKRIADVMSGGALEATGFANLEQLAWSMGRSFEHGRRTDR